MTRKQIKERFGRDVVVTKDPKEANKTRGKSTDTFDIYEIWDRAEKKVIFLSKGELTPLEVNEDPLRLQQFYPCIPMMLNLDPQEMIPKPDYDYIESFDIELNRLQERRQSLLESMKASGAYDPGLPELKDMVELEDGEYVAVKGLLQRMQTVGGPEGVIYHLPLAEKLTVIQGITEQIGLIRAQIDDILGISDIVRGVTNAAETATAQEIKGRWVGIRLARKRDQVQYTVREMFRIMGQLLTSHFTPQNLQRLTQKQLDPQALQLLQNDLMMDFAIDIEAESTVAKDEFRERETRQEMMAGISAFAQGVMPMVQQGAMPADVSSAVLAAALQPYAKYSRGLDEAIVNLPTNQQQLQQLTQQLQQQGQQMQQMQVQLQQWQAIATQLQQQATAAKAQKETADAGKKQAETQKIYSELGQAGQPNNLETADKVAEIDVKRAQAAKLRSDAEAPRGQG